MIHNPPDSEKPPEPQRPSFYMRARRPHLFSDSIRKADVSLSREVLSYHLESLTKQKSETVFEGFAKRLVEKFIAPNLRPQTGPTGGGDGKTDAETYPVATAVSERWFMSNSAAASERWAFAFSAKKDWRGKIRSDIKSITSTGRGYPRLFFVTNQYAPAGQSAEVQDTLEKEFGTPITILDRTWLLDCVFERDSLPIAREVLGVGAELETTQVGPRDLTRQTELDKLEMRLADPSEYEGSGTALATDALRAAKLARGLEKPRLEVDGRYERAVKISRQRSLESQHLSAVYEWAWTSYFWFDDAHRLAELYDVAEKLAITSRDANDLEKLSNLLPLIVGAVSQGFLSSDDGQINRRRAALMAALEEMKAETARPNNALHAHALLLLLRIAAEARDNRTGDLDRIWEEFASVIEQSTGLGSFPFESIAGTLSQLGDLLPDSQAFDSLYEKLTDTLSQRKREGEAARLNSERGYQKLRKRLSYDAIRWFGRAVADLVKAEYEDELVKALSGCSIAYLESGLYWAARNYALAAVIIELRKFKMSGNADDLSPAVLSQWFECELRLGRVPLVLIAYELATMVRHARSRTLEQKKFADEILIEQGNKIGALVVGTSFDDLRGLSRLPASLDRLGLLQVSMTLMFLMGGEQILREQSAVPIEETNDNINSLFDQLAAARKSAELPIPDYLLADQAFLQSRILGCHITLICENSLTSLAIAEAIIGALEALLATSLNLKVFPHLDRLTIRVQVKEGEGVIPSFKLVDERGATVAIIDHRSSLEYTTREEAVAFPKWLRDTVIRLFVAFAVPEDLESWGDTVLGEEQAFSRAVMFSNIPTAYDIIFGNVRRFGLDHWVEDGDPEIEVTRASAWSPRQTVSVAQERPIDPDVARPPPPDWFDGESRRHSDYRIVSPIDAFKWNAARWRGTFFMCSPGSCMTPILGLVFEEKEPAAAIMEALRERYGDSDPNDDLRIAIITGVNISNPAAYAVIVGPNVQREQLISSEIVGFVARINVMTPTNTYNLDMFLSEFSRLKRFKLVAAQMTSETTEPELASPIAIEKFNLSVCPAWTISENNSDCMALNLDDPPVIPMDQVNPPVLKALDKLAKLREKRRTGRGTL